VIGDNNAGYWDFYFGSDLDVWEDDGDDVLLTMPGNSDDPIDYLAFGGGGDSEIDALPSTNPFSIGFSGTPPSAPGATGSVGRDINSNDTDSNADMEVFSGFTSQGELNIPHFSRPLIPIMFAGLIAIVFSRKRKQKDR